MGGLVVGGVKALLQLANFTLGPDATLNTEIHKTSVRIKAPNSVNASKPKHKNQINHYNKQRRVLMANSTVCQSKVSLKIHTEAVLSMYFKTGFQIQRENEKMRGGGGGGGGGGLKHFYS